MNQSCLQAETKKALARKDAPGDVAAPLEREESDGHWEERLSGPPQPTLGISCPFAGRGRQEEQASPASQLCSLGFEMTVARAA